MKKILIPLSIFFLGCIASCDSPSGNGKTMSEADKNEKALADSLYKEVSDGHDVGMSKMGKLTRAQQEVTRILDSITKLPAKARITAAPYKLKLDSLLSKLSYSETAMNKWMEEFKYDTLEKNIKGGIQYMAEEKEKVAKIKGYILGSLQEADSMLKKKF